MAQARVVQKYIAVANGMIYRVEGEDSSCVIIKESTTGDANVDEAAVADPDDVIDHVVEAHILSENDAEGIDVDIVVVEEDEGDIDGSVLVKSLMITNEKNVCDNEKV